MRTVQHIGAGYDNTIHHQDEVHLEQLIIIWNKQGMMDRNDCRDIRIEISNALDAAQHALRPQQSLGRLQGVQTPTGQIMAV